MTDRLITIPNGLKQRTCITDRGQFTFIHTSNTAHSVFRLEHSGYWKPAARAFSPNNKCLIMTVIISRWCPVTVSIKIWRQHNLACVFRAATFPHKPHVNEQKWKHADIQKALQKWWHIHSGQSPFLQGWSQHGEGVTRQSKRITKGSWLQILWAPVNTQCPALCTAIDTNKKVWSDLSGSFQSIKADFAGKKNNHCF